VRVERVTAGQPVRAGLAGAILTRDLSIAGERWSKGRRLSAADLDALARAPVARRGITVLVPGPADLLEDEAATRLAAVVAGPGLVAGPPVQSRVDLRAATAGVVHVRVAAVTAINRLDPVEVFTILDGRVVDAGDLVASVKVAPHVVPAAVVARAEATAAAARAAPVVRVAPFRSARIAAIVKEGVTGLARDRFEASLAARVEGLGSVLVGVDYVEDDPERVTEALAARIRGREPGRADLVLTAGSASTDPLDAFYLALERLGGRVVRHGIPAHPGSMLWLGRVGRVAVVGLPSCGAYSKATAADLLLPLLLSGEPPSARTIARLGHGGILTRDQRFRLPRYARTLDAPEG
jgi:molybdenum cofactor cytidylyltransferase